MGTQTPGDTWTGLYGWRFGKEGGDEGGSVSSVRRRGGLGEG